MQITNAVKKLEQENKLLKAENENLLKLLEKKKKKKRVFVTKKAIHYGNPYIAGLFYKEKNTYYVNLDRVNGGKAIVFMSEKRN